MVECAPGAEDDLDVRYEQESMLSLPCVKKAGRVVECCRSEDRQVELRGLRLSAVSSLSIGNVVLRFEGCTRS